MRLFGVLCHVVISKVNVTPIIILMLYYLKKFHDIDGLSKYVPALNQALGPPPTELDCQVQTFSPFLSSKGTG